MLKPTECESLHDIRSAIDALDHQIITLLGRRFEYVKAAARFKTDEAGVKAPERFTAMLKQRSKWASENGLNPDAIVKLYRDLITHFIEEELKQWKTGKP